MANTSYTYVIVDEFTNDVVDPEKFELEVEDSSPAITSANLLGTKCDGDPQNPGALTEFVVWFDDPLTSGDETQLDALVAAHDGAKTKDINTTDAALASTDELLIQTSSDKTDTTVGLERDGSGNLMFKDGVVSGTKTLTELLAGSGGLTEGSHKTLRQLIHFIDDGPADGFASGAYKEVTGTVFPTVITWWESSSKLKRIVERTITWTGVNATTDKWEIYDADGTTKLWIITDTISYSGVFETSRTRTIAAGP